MNRLQKTYGIDRYSLTPKYLQLTNSILKSIKSGRIKKNDVLPSINEFSCSLETARSTIERAYNELKRRGIVKSVAGKGFFIIHTSSQEPIKILLLFNKLSVQKKIIYDAFVAKIGNLATIDFYIYNDNFHEFKRLLQEKSDEYAKYVIIPHFIKNKEKGYNLIDALPKEKLILMDKLADGIDGDFAAVYEDFESDIFSALVELKRKLKKYHTIKIICPDRTHYSRMILMGFINFCKEYNFDYEIVNCLKKESVEYGCVYINLIENDLATLIDKIIKGNFRVGKDIGVISYNETPIMKFILDGITTISTDFKMMGEKLQNLCSKTPKNTFRYPLK